MSCYRSFRHALNNAQSLSDIAFQIRVVFLDELVEIPLLAGFAKRGHAVLRGLLG